MRSQSLTNSVLTIAFLGAAACTPNNAVVDQGTYMTFLADKTSKTLFIDAVDINDMAYHQAIDCRCDLAVVYDTDNEATCPSPDGSGACYSCAEFIPDSNGEYEDERFEDFNEDGVNDYDYDNSPCFVQSNAFYDQGIPTDADGNPTENWWNNNPYRADGLGAPRFINESWVHRDSFQIVGEDIAPWRGEAIITTEGDFQVTFHHELPGGGDFRFAFAIDPNFQPTECLGESGNVSLEPVDGDWLENWSRDVDGTLFFLNSGSYQFNPNDMEDTWTLPQDWRAGYAQGKYAEEDMYVRPSRYGSPAAYGEYEALGDLFGQQFVDVDDLFYIDLDEGDDPLTHDSNGDKITDFEEMAIQIQDISTAISLEFSDLDYNVDSFKYDFTPQVHVNDWRAPDGLASGLDSWGELQYSWVQINSGSNLEVGGSATGTFQLILEAAESQSRTLITAEFHTDLIEAEKWGAYDINAIKLEENAAVICGEQMY